MGMKTGASDGGAKGGGLPGVKKNKDMNAYKDGGPVMSSGKARGAGKAQRGFDFKVV